MTYNPYAPPDDNFFNNAGGPQPVQGAPQGWEIEEVIRLAWDRYKADWITIQFGSLLAAAPAQLLGLFSNGIVQRLHYQPFSKEFWGISIGIGLLGNFITAYFQAGLLRMMLRAARGQEASFGQLFSGGPSYFAMLGVLWLQFIGIFAGTLLFLVPGILLGLGFLLAQYYVVDAGMGPIQALGASWDAMRGHKGQTFLFFLVWFVITLISVCTCVGPFIASAVLHVALAIVFTRVSGRTASSTDVVSPYGQGGPTGGYGAGPMPPPGGGWGAA
ncbi:MAG: hypothetical protein U0441_39045 [Polyangiaceae bacterium]